MNMSKNRYMSILFGLWALTAIVSGSFGVMLLTKQELFLSIYYIAQSLLLAMLSFYVFTQEYMAKLGKEGK